jgi:hypothetical protein
MFLQLVEFVVWPRAHRSSRARDERARGQHERGVRREVSRHFNSFVARPNADGAALAICGQQHYRRGQNVRQQEAESSRIALGRSVLALKGEIVMRAETLQPRLAFVAPAPAPEFLAHILNLFPQQPRGAVTTARLELHDRCSHLDHAGVEINRATGGELEGAPRARHHLLANQPLRRSEYYLRPPPNIIDQKAELRLQTDDSARRRKMNPLAAFGAFLFYDSLHSRGTRVR